MVRQPIHLEDQKWTPTYSNGEIGQNTQGIYEVEGTEVNNVD